MKPPTPQHLDKPNPQLPSAPANPSQTSSYAAEFLSLLVCKIWLSWNIVLTRPHTSHHLREMCLVFLTYLWFGSLSSSVNLIKLVWFVYKPPLGEMLLLASDKDPSSIMKNPATLINNALLNHLRRVQNLMRNTSGTMGRKCRKPQRRLTWKAWMKWVKDPAR